MSRVGMIPACPLLPACAAGGLHPRPWQDFCDRIGVARANSTVDVALFEHCIREDLNAKAPRVMGVLEPLKVVITNWPEDKVEWLEIENLPGNDAAGTHLAPLTREIYIESGRFSGGAAKKYHRLSPGKEVRLKGAYIIKCDDVTRMPSARLWNCAAASIPIPERGRQQWQESRCHPLVSVQHGCPPPFASMINCS